MKIPKLFTAVVFYMLGATAYADPATYNSAWQYNNNVTIEKMYIHWDTSATRVLLSNNEVCHIAKDDKELYSAALAMRSQKASGEVICQIANAGSFNGATDRRMHRLTY